MLETLWSADPSEHIGILLVHRFHASHGVHWIMHI